MDPLSTRVSVVGLGLMGRPLAGTLASAGFTVSGWNRSPLPPEVTAGIPLVTSEDEIAAADVVLLVLADSAATGKVLARVEPHLRPGSVVLDMGSSEPADSRERAARLASRGVGWVDAPVSGGPDAAAAGTLAVMAGGAAEHVAFVRPVLSALGANVAHVGGVGAGHTMKIVNQVIVGLSIETVAEALALAERVGFGIPDVQQAVRGGSADSHQLRAQGTRMAERDWIPGGRARTMLKDLRMAERLAAEHGLELPQLRAAVAQYEALADRGDGDRDLSLLIELHRGSQATNAAFQAITDRLLETIVASRTTIRLDRPDDVFPVVAESLAPGVNSIAGQEVPGLRQAPTMLYLAETLDILVQDDLLETETPPPPALIHAYGARAQMIAAIVKDDQLVGIVSVHHGPDVRQWTDGEIAQLRAAASEAAALLG